MPSPAMAALRNASPLFAPNGPLTGTVVLPSLPKCQRSALVVLDKVLCRQACAARSAAFLGALCAAR